MFIIRLSYPYSGQPNVCSALRMIAALGRSIRFNPSAFGSPVTHPWPNVAMRAAI
jgi:hypothetical protein